MQFESQILRFQQGTRSKHPAPDATIASVQSGTLSQQGEQLAVLVDLTPLLPYRSREIRTLAVKTYWASSGTIVARLRRALAAANRYLVNLNEEANPGSKCTGSITCAVFAHDELFLGQVGAAHTYVLHGDNPDNPTSMRRFEVYPERKHLMIALGDALPPSIHISYTQLEVGSTIFLASTSVAESQARELWQQAMSMPGISAVTNTISKAIENNRASGTVIVSRVLADPQPGQAAQPTSRRQARRRAKAVAVATPVVEEPTPAPALAEEVVPQAPPEPKPVSDEVETAPEGRPAREKWLQRFNRATRGQAPTGTLVVGRGRAEAYDDELDEDDIEEPEATQHTQTFDGMEIDTETGEILEEQTPRQRRQTDLVWTGLWFKTFFAEMRKGAPKKPKQGDKQQLRTALRSLLPEEQEASKPKRSPRRPPTERKHLLQGFLAGIILIIAVITFTMNAQLGGADRAQKLEESLQTTRDAAYNKQDQAGWEKVIREAQGILALDESNIVAQEILEQAESALLALENAAILDVIQLYELPVATGERKLILANQTLVILDMSTDEVFSFQLNDDYQSLAQNTPKPILRKGQTVDGIPVGELLDIAWIPESYNYSSNYDMIYVLGENGALFTHELTAATTADSAVVHAQQLMGELGPGTVSAMETFGTRIYLVHQAANQLWSYNPTNATYGLPQVYLPDSNERDLTNIFDLVIDQRVYLLMGDGTVMAYYDGVEDYSFTYDGVTDQPFDAQVIAVEQASGGSIILADPTAQRIALFSKRGRLQYLFRTNDDTLAHIESIAIAENTGEDKVGVLYFIAGNRLYAAPLPAFVN